MLVMTAKHEKWTSLLLFKDELAILQDLEQICIFDKREEEIRPLMLHISQPKWGGVCLS